MKSHQKTYIWLLLAIMLSMQAINAVHIHEPLQVLSNEEYCDMCAHHVKHYSHISVEHYHMHPCLLCQISINQQFTLQSATLWSFQQTVCSIDRQETLSLPAITPNHRQSRAPPVFLV